MVSVTKKYQVTIPRGTGGHGYPFRRSGGICQERKRNCIHMTVKELTDKMVKHQRIDETIKESREGFKRGTSRTLKSLGD
jgi:hypothetical protein